MKKFFLLGALMFMVSNGYSQSISDVSTAIVLSPFITATKLLEFTAVTTLAAIQSTRSAVQARGVAGKEQLKDELVALNEALLAGQVRTIADVGQPGLRELFEEMLADEKQMEVVHSTVQDGTELHKIATVVTMVLLME